MPVNQYENESGTIRMPKQTVRAGRGEPGYHVKDGVKLVTYDPKAKAEPERTKRISGPRTKTDKSAES